MSEKLLPCPFCGGEPYFSQPVFGSKWWDVSCNNEACGIVGPSRPGKIEAVEAWNRRGASNPSPVQSLQGEVDRLKADRNLFAGKYRSIIVLMDDTRQKVQEVVDHIQDEGDRAFFGSTNHADWLRDLVEDMDGWSFDAMLPKGDINKMERDPYAECRQLRTNLKLAIEHIEHMAAFIGPLKAGYSFESLGEDMPGIKAALNSEGSADGR